MSSVAVRSQYSDIFGSGALPVLEELVETNYEMYPSLRERLFKVVPHDRDIWQSSERHDLPAFRSMTEGETYTYERPMQGASKTLTVVKYGLGFSISEEMVEDSKFAEMAMMAEGLGRSARESQEVTAMNVINNGFSAETTADGVALFHATHTLPRGGSFRNTLSTAADLSPSSLETAIIDFRTQFVTDGGIKLAMRPQILLVPEELRLYAKELVGSENKPDSADNNINSLKGEGLTVISSPHLTDSDGWFLFGDKSQCGLRIISRRQFSTKRSGDDLGFHSDSLYVKGKYREKVGAIHPWASYGVAGA